MHILQVLGALLLHVALVSPVSVLAQECGSDGACEDLKSQLEALSDKLTVLENGQKENKDQIYTLQDQYDELSTKLSSSKGSGKVTADDDQISALDTKLAALQKSQELYNKAFSYLKGAAKGGNKIFISQGEVANWDGAVSICRNYGGQLATPTNREENQAVFSVRNQFGQHAFLGYNDRQQKGVFKDLNGDVMTYLNWYRGQPDNYMGKEHCGQMWETGQWNDQDCSITSLVICQFQ